MIHQGNYCHKYTFFLLNKLVTLILEVGLFNKRARVAQWVR